MVQRDPRQPRPPDPGDWFFQGILRLARKFGSLSNPPKPTLVAVSDSFAHLSSRQASPFFTLVGVHGNVAAASPYVRIPPSPGRAIRVVTGFIYNNSSFGTTPAGPYMLSQMQTTLGTIIGTSGVGSSFSLVGDTPQKPNATSIVVANAPSTNINTVTNGPDTMVYGFINGAVEKPFGARVYPDYFYEVPAGNDAILHLVAVDAGTASWISITQWYEVTPEGTV